MGALWGLGQDMGQGESAFGICEPQRPRGSPTVVQREGGE